jgi:hypothetical protein
MGFGQTSLSGVRRGFMPPQLKTKTNHAHVKTPGILNKFPENKIFVGCMVWP